MAVGPGVDVAVSSPTPIGHMDRVGWAGVAYSPKAPGCVVGGQTRCSAFAPRVVSPSQLRRPPATHPPCVLCLRARRAAPLPPCVLCFLSLVASLERRMAVEKDGESLRGGRRDSSEGSEDQQNCGSDCCTCTCGCPGPCTSAGRWPRVTPGPGPAGPARRAGGPSCSTAPQPPVFCVLGLALQPPTPPVFCGLLGR